MVHISSLPAFQTRTRQAFGKQKSRPKLLGAPHRQKSGLQVEDELQRSGSRRLCWLCEAEETYCGDSINGSSALTSYEKALKAVCIVTDKWQSTTPAMASARVSILPSCTLYTLCYTVVRVAPKWRIGENTVLFY